jgi:hypothetical protein
MPSKKTAGTSQPATPLAHGALALPLVTIEDFNIEVKDGDGFVGDAANKKAFQKKLEEWRKRMRKVGEDPLGKTPTADLSKKDVDAILKDKNAAAAALVLSAIEDFAQDFAEVIEIYMKQKNWQKTERLVVGGGFRQSRVGELAIARTEYVLRSRGANVGLVPIVHHPDKAGLIGSIHLMPSWMLTGHDAMLAVDIGGTNLRAGIVTFGGEKKPFFADAEVGALTRWRHADDNPSRTATVQRLVSMLEELIESAAKDKLKLAPVIGIGCPGVIREDGAIDRGGQNLPGGNWESDHFNLPAKLIAAIPMIGEHPTFVMMHNDAVVQGLSQIPFMRDVKRWGMLTIGTGLGNALFVNNEGT